MPIFLLPQFMRKYIYKNRGMMRLIHLSTWLTFLFSTFVLGIYFFEKSTLEEAVWLAWQTFTTVGYGDLPAKTILGRLMTMVVGTAGIGFLTSFIGILMEIKLEKITRRRYGFMPNKTKNSCVIVGIPSVADFFLFREQFKSQGIEMHFCIVDEKAEELPLEISSLGLEVHFVKDRLLRPKTYKKANVEHASSVIVLPKESGVSASDALTESIARMISRMIDPKKTRLTYIYVDPENRPIFDELPAVGILENFEILGLFQEIVDQYTYQITERLLRNSSDEVPHTVDIDSEIMGWTWGKLTRSISELSEETGADVNPLAHIRGHEPTSCPSQRIQIEEGDQISIIVHHGFNWKKFQRELIKEYS
ncbi:ion channel [Patescibacteria group bacterium]